MVKIFFRIRLVPLFLFFIVGCRKYPDAVQLTLKESGTNRIELEKAITHYSNSQKDSLKLEALYFLISNMRGHVSYQSKQLDGYNQIFDIIRNREKYKPLDGNIHFPVIYMAWDSLAHINGPLQKEYLNTVSDERKITSQLLIENIDYAFEAWNRPWANHLSFPEFCEYILPYRFYDEPLESWRPLYARQFAWLEDSMHGSTDPVKACELINNDIKKWFRFNEVFNSYPHSISPVNLLKTKMGKCLDQAGVSNFAMRSMGIPVVHEFVPQWGDRSLGHDFSSVLAKSGLFVAFLGGELSPGKNELRGSPPKIYRHLFSRHGGYRTNESGFNRNIQPFLDPFTVDVTGKYIPVTTARFKIPADEIKNIDYSRVCVFNNSTWVPVSEGYSNGECIEFRGLGRNIVYLPIYFKKGKGYLSSRPFKIDNTGKVIQLISDMYERQDLVAKRKYPLNGIKLRWMTLMGGGKFQGANSIDFADAKTLYFIRDTIEMKYHRNKVFHEDRYRYVRYLFPDNKYGSLGEIAFYSRGEEFPLNGRILKSVAVDSADALLTFDGKVDKFIHTPYEYSYNSQWVGLDLGAKKLISDVGYSPRNDRNNIMKGMTYQLLFWGNGKWNTAGTKVSENSDFITFKGVPKNALFWLRNLTEGNEERIFTYSNGIQVWW